MVHVLRSFTTASLLLLLTVGCSPDAEPAGGGGVDVPAGSADVSGNEPDMIEPDSAAVAAAIDEADAADADAERTFAERQAAMDTREGCLRKLEGLAPDVKKVLTDACGRLRSEKDVAPR